MCWAIPLLSEVRERGKPRSSCFVVQCLPWGEMGSAQARRHASVMRLEQLERFEHQLMLFNVSARTLAGSFRSSFQSADTHLINSQRANQQLRTKIKGRVLGECRVTFGK